jgi:cardiolipin synthase
MDWGTANLALNIILFLIPVVMLFIVPVNRKPTTAIAWLLLIAMLPVLGLILFLVFGRSKLPAHRRAQQHTMDAWIRARVAELRQTPELSPLVNPTVPARYQPLARLNAALGSLPVCGGNRVALISGYHDILQRLVADIEGARHYIHLEFFALSRDDETEPVFAALERAAGRGVKVRVLMDHYGSLIYPHYRSMQRRLTAAGIEHQVMLPINLFDRDFARFDLRNHRKLVVVDGAIGYIGSHNLVRRNYFRTDAVYYDELVAHVTGPAALQLEAVFVTDWHAETGVILSRERFAELATDIRPAGEGLAQVLPSGPGYASANNLALFTALAYAAQRQLVLVTPYFVPNESLMLALTTAARRGVEVTLINSAAADQFLAFHAQRSYYAELLAAGVTIHLYRPPALLHAKTIRVDDDLAVIGSSNLDIRSFQLDLEVTLVVPDQGVVAELRRIESEYLRRSTPLELTAWQARPWHARMSENVARLTSALQ